MSISSANVPRVFISYSHDSAEHKSWVLKLATILRGRGIDVILDEWDLGLGDDVPKFMEKSVTEADRVLMVCTEKYVHKADEGMGGVGYETMIVTAELVQNLGTSKFIPVIRQQSAKPRVPKSVSTRRYVNLSHGGNFDEELSRLTSELHDMRRSQKPPLGPAPFVSAPATEQGVSDSKGSSLAVAAIAASIPEDPLAAYRLALGIIQREDMIAWRGLVRNARRLIPDRFNNWRTKYERVAVPQQEQEKWFQDFAAEGVEVCTPLFAVALAGVVSCKPTFNNQSAILDDLLYPKNWNRNGYRYLTDLPQASVFVYQALHGAVSVNTQQIGLAVRLARERIGEGSSGPNSEPLYQCSELIGWPYTLGGNSLIAWDFLWKLVERWPWLDEVFGDMEEYKAAMSAYYMVLNIVELVDYIAGGHTINPSNIDLRLCVPLRTPAMPDEVVRKAYRLLLSVPEQIAEVWLSRKLKEEDVRKQWQLWMSATARMLHREYPFATVRMIQENLFEDLEARL